jgi:predicted DNA-binding transcriptional regulator YafY
MPRNAEVIRQWTVLQHIERTRGAGATIDDLATRCGVTTRTIRRDLQALEAAGFPLYDDRDGTDGRTRWKINGQAFRGVAAGLTFGELCALYFSRTVVASLAEAPFRDDVERAFGKLVAGLSPHMRQFLDRLPQVIVTKQTAAGRGGDRLAAQRIERLVEASLQSRPASIVYDSRSSSRTKPYIVHPYRLAYADAAVYLLAYVPEYGEVRTFAVDRIREVRLLEDRFTPPDDLPADAFPHSIGVHSGSPERVEVEFGPEVSEYVATRTWHPSQQLTPNGVGRLRMRLHVSVDRPLKRWILSFGASARVIAPAHLRDDITAQLNAAAANYNARGGGKTPDARTSRP